MLAAPSSSEYSEWTCRCAQAWVLTESSRLGAGSDASRAPPTTPPQAAAVLCSRPRWAASCLAWPLGGLRPVQPRLQQRHGLAVAAHDRPVAGRGGLAPEQGREPPPGHLHRRVRAVLRRRGVDPDAAAVADDDVPGAGRVAGEALGDGEGVVARPGGVYHVGERPEDEGRLQPRAGPRRLGEAERGGGDGLERLEPALAAGDPRGAPEAPDLVRDARDQLGERERVGGEMELRLPAAARLP